MFDFKAEKEKLEGEIEKAAKDILEKTGKDLLRKKAPSAVGKIVGDIVDKEQGDDRTEFELLGQSIGKVMAFKVLPAGQIGDVNLEMTFTDRGAYSYNGKSYLGGTNASFRGYMDPTAAGEPNRFIFYVKEANNMSVAQLGDGTQTWATWNVNGLAELAPSLTGAGTYRGGIQYRWDPDGPFAPLNRMPCIYELVLNDLGFTFGTIWRWVDPDADGST